MEIKLKGGNSYEFSKILVRGILIITFIYFLFIFFVTPDRVVFSLSDFYKYVTPSGFSKTLKT